MSFSTTSTTGAFATEFEVLRSKLSETAVPRSIRASLRKLYYTSVPLSNVSGYHSICIIYVCAGVVAMEMGLW